MSDYIKREDAIGIVKNLKRFSCFGDDGFVQIPMVYCELMKVTSADVAPVRHGRWIGCTSSPHWKCSMCGTKASIWFDEFDEICEWLSDYCPNCGARMDGEEDV